jgi:UDP-N-acetylglucosamine:LPS N-acetylglucosamine transferase
MRDDADTIARRLQAAGSHVRATPFGNDTPLHQLIAAADVMVGNSSASGLESIALGVPVVFFHNPNLYDVNALYSMDDAVMLAADTPELVAALDTLERDEAAVQRLRAAWPGCLARLLYRLDTAAEDRCLAFLREQAPASTPAA